MSTLLKRPSEIRLYDMDFSQFPEIQNGDRLSMIISIVPTIIQGSGSLPSQSGQAITTDGKGVTVTLIGGSPNIIIQYVFTAQTAGGATLEGVGNLQMLPI